MRRNIWIAAAAAAAVIVAVVVVVVVAMAGGDHGDMDGAHTDRGHMGDGPAWTGPMADMGDMPGMRMDASGAMAMDEQAFLAMMVGHHRMAVDMARIEVDRGRHPATRALARRVIAAQRDEIARMRAWYRDWFSGEIPSMPMSGAMAMMGMHMDMDDLRGADDPDREFLRMMQPHHAGALLMADMVLAGGPRREVADLARRIVADQATEIGEMQALRQEVAPPLG